MKQKLFEADLQVGDVVTWVPDMGVLRQETVTKVYVSFIELTGRLTLGNAYTMIEVVSRATDKTPDTPSAIEKKCNELKELLLQKNKDYGNSALEPIRIFSTADAVEQLKVRIDDKLSRLKNTATKNFKEDTAMDLAGYLILLMVAQDA